MGRLHRQGCRFATAWGVVALGVVACTSGAPPARSNSATGASLGDAATTGASDGFDDATANGDASSSNALPTPDMTGPLPGEDSTGGESSTSGSDTLGALPGCDLYEQDCPAGEKCTIWGSEGGELPDAVRCVPVWEEAQQPGDWCEVAEPLSGVDNCASGSFCQLGAGDMTYGVCVSYCTGGPDDARCDNPDQACGLFFEGIAPLCLTACEGDDVCPQNQICHTLSMGLTFCVAESSIE